MNEHLPECPVEKRLRAGRTVGSQTCICAALRACEARVLNAAREAVLGAKAVDVAYGRGLDEPAQFIWLNHALEAIDALKEKL